jgi:hypothetical protein
MGALFSKNLADMQFASICDEATPAGMVPNFGSQRGGSPDRSEPPVGAYCLLKLYRQFEDRSMLAKYYEVLKKWNHWWYPRRDANGDGLIELGSDPNVGGIGNGFFDEGNGKQTGIFESGMDNSPMYDDVVFNTETHTLELNDIGQNSLYALDCYCMGIIAGELGKIEDSGIFTREYNRVKDLVQKTMWDAEESMYCNTRWDGKKDHVYSPTNFYPIIAGIATAEQAKAMIQKHLLNENEFGGKYVIPTIGRNQRGFTDQNYWRGRVWGPANYLVYEGLRRLGDRESAAIIAEKGLALFREEWEAEGHIHENYNSITGDGDDVRNADPYYTWGALLAYIPVTEFIYMDIDRGVHFGGTKLPGSLIKEFPLADARYTLDTREGFCLLRNGKPFIKSDSPIELDSYRVENGKASFTVNGRGLVILEKQDDLDELVIHKDGAPVYSGKLPAKAEV